MEIELYLVKHLKKKRKPYYLRSQVYAKSTKMYLKKKLQCRFNELLLIDKIDVLKTSKI